MFELVPQAAPFSFKIIKKPISKPASKRDSLSSQRTRQLSVSQLDSSSQIESENTLHVPQFPPKGKERIGPQY